MLIPPPHPAVLLQRAPSFKSKDVSPLEQLTRELLIWTQESRVSTTLQLKKQGLFCIPHIGHHQASTCRISFFHEPWNLQVLALHACSHRLTQSLSYLVSDAFPFVFRWPSGSPSSLLAISVLIFFATAFRFAGDTHFSLIFGFSQYRNSRRKEERREGRRKWTFPGLQWSVLTVQGKEDLLTSLRSESVGTCDLHRLGIYLILRSPPASSLLPGFFDLCI